MIRRRTDSLLRFSLGLLGCSLAVLLLGPVGCTPNAEPGDRGQQGGLFDAEGVSTGRFNVLLISLDTLRADRLSIYGSERPTSPFLDQYSQSSFRFSTALAQAPHTRPSHNSIFQSQLSSKTTDERQMLAQVLAANGYQTAGFVAGGNISGKLGFSRGFETWEEAPGVYGETFRRAEAWLHEAPPSPFFLFVHTYDTHLPYDPPEPFGSMFVDPGYKGWISAEDSQRLAHRVRERGKHQDSPGPKKLNADDLDAYLGLYDGGIRYVDDQLRSLLGTLEELDLDARTYVFIVSDHGEEFLDHDSLSHGHTIYQELIHVPWILRPPRGLQEGRVIEEAVPLLDLSPTLLDLLGLPPSPAFRGVSLKPLLQGHPLPPRPVISEINAQKSLVLYPWKLIKDFATQEVELYDLRADPKETQRLEEQDPERVALLLAVLDAELAGGNAIVDVNAQAEAVEDEELREQLRALGYID